MISARCKKGVVNQCFEETRGFVVQVSVRDNDVERALRILKRKLQREGVFRTMKDRRFYVKPSQKRVLAKQEAQRRERRLNRKRQDNF